MAMSDDAAKHHGGAGVSPAFHIELRQFPHNLCRFNLSEHELRSTIVEPWAREEWIEQGERKWSPHQAKLTVLEGPSLPIEALSMGRGWRAAQRQSQDVTERMLALVKEDMAEAKERVDEGARPQGNAAYRHGDADRQLDTASIQDEALLADSLGLELLAQLGSDSAPLRRAWELALTRHPERTAGQCLALAERAVLSLLGSRLIVLSSTDGAGGTRHLEAEAEIQAWLRSVEGWTGDNVSVARR
jgi:hypothetical protein